MQTVIVAIVGVVVLLFVIRALVRIVRTKGGSGCGCGCGCGCKSSQTSRREGKQS